MPPRLRVACVQISAGADPEKNLAIVREKIKEALKKGAKLIALPENFCFRGASEFLSTLAGKITPAVITEFKTLARRHKTAFLLGSLIERGPRGKFFNTSYLISENGKIAAKYRKIHLFDVSLKNVKVRESKYLARGSEIVTAKVCGIQTGLSICYDLRFSELYRSLSAKGACLIFVPANFTETTGRAHWEVLLRARAIENQAFVVAPAQSGKNPESGLASFGCSLIVDPWGSVLARGSRDGVEVVAADMDFKILEKIRRELPALKHRRL